MRRTPLSRNTSLKAGSSQRLEPERPLATWCEVQLGGCYGRATQRHERKRRSQGGDGSRANTADVCAYCQAYIHDHPAEAYGKGWLVEHWRDPAEVPMSLSPHVLEPDVERLDVW